MELTSVIGRIPYRMALSGGWIDQPFVSALNPDPPGSMVVVGLEPAVRYMERCGMATGTRNVALGVWGDGLPPRDPAELTRELYDLENQGRDEPSGSQDMIGLIYPGVCRLDYDVTVEGGYFPCHIEQCCDPAVARWIEDVFWLLPVNQRPPGYNPLGLKQLDAEWVRRLSQSGRDCYDALVGRDLAALGAAMNETMAAWEALLPHVVRHPTISHDLVGLMQWYQRRYPGAMYSGCGGGYLFVVSEEPVPGAAKVHVRTS